MLPSETNSLLRINKEQQQQQQQTITDKQTNKQQEITFHLSRFKVRIFQQTRTNKIKFASQCGHNSSICSRHHCCHNAFILTIRLRVNIALPVQEEPSMQFHETPSFTFAEENY
jgi:hypothetical protein